MESVTKRANSYSNKYHCRWQTIVWIMDYMANMGSEQVIGFSFLFFFSDFSFTVSQFWMALLSDYRFILFNFDNEHNESTNNNDNNSSINAAKNVSRKLQHLKTTQFDAINEIHLIVYFFLIRFRFPLTFCSFSSTSFSLIQLKRIWKLIKAKCLMAIIISFQLWIIIIAWSERKICDWKPFFSSSRFEFLFLSPSRSDSAFWGSVKVPRKKKTHRCEKWWEMSFKNEKKNKFTCYICSAVCSSPVYASVWAASWIRLFLACFRSNSKLMFLFFVPTHALSSVNFGRALFRFAKDLWRWKFVGGLNVQFFDSSLFVYPNFMFNSIWFLSKDFS